MLVIECVCVCVMSEHSGFLEDFHSTCCDFYSQVSFFFSMSSSLIHKGKTRWSPSSRLHLCSPETLHSMFLHAVMYNVKIKALNIMLFIILSLSSLPRSLFSLSPSLLPWPCCQPKLLPDRLNISLWGRSSSAWTIVRLLTLLWLFSLKNSRG